MLASRIFANSRNLMLPFNPLFTGSSVGKVFRFDSILGGFSAGKIAKCWLKLIEDNQRLKGKVQKQGLKAKLTCVSFFSFFLTVPWAC